jgi:hypothetical protein
MKTGRVVGTSELGSPSRSKRDTSRSSNTATSPSSTRVVPDSDAIALTKSGKRTVCSTPFRLTRRKSDAASGLIGDQAPAVDLFLVDPTGAVEGLDERDDIEGDKAGHQASSCQTHPGLPPARATGGWRPVARLLRLDPATMCMDFVRAAHTLWIEVLRGKLLTARRARRTGSAATRTEPVDRFFDDGQKNGSPKESVGEKDTEGC